ncbi:cyclic nucleotide-gated ion channel 1-like [Prunus yedoensis var. nudiflora]|uniref:Cyclic nucleotide-gated ion channel 1-like n=1 Tax=Prunus yedoensis var. nudiflora TaxID=2094558 RepID=A0A314Y7F9_PRUYE|nr:cyclic nucleotide-gated ion channel 1-like [Prunus yedoensis var. nudiflora]
MAAQHSDDSFIVSTTHGIGFNKEDAKGQARHPTSKSGGLKPKEKWETKLLSASLWKRIVISCVIAVSLDPLFFYIPFIDKEKKCLGMDKKLRNVALILRSLTDITFVVHIGYQIWEAGNKAYKAITKEKSQLDWQPTMKPTLKKHEIIPFAKKFAGYFSWLSFLTDLLSVLPMPQILVVVLFFKMKGPKYLQHRKALNIFLLSQYLPRIFRIILSSKKLIKTTGIQVKAVFNFFLYILASHTFIQLTTTKSEDIRQKIKIKEEVLEKWMEKNNVPEDLKKEIMKNIHQTLKKDKDADLGNLFDVLPRYTRKILKRHLCWDILSEVQFLKVRDEKVLKMICDYATPVTFPENTIIFQMGHPVDRMLFIIEGTVLTYSTTSDPGCTRGGKTTTNNSDSPSIPPTNLGEGRFMEKSF